MRMTRRMTIAVGAALALAAGGAGAAIAVGGGTDEADERTTGPAADRAADAARSGRGGRSRSAPPTAPSWTSSWTPIFAASAPRPTSPRARATRTRRGRLSPAAAGEQRSTP